MSDTDRTLTEDQVARFDQLIEEGEEILGEMFGKAEYYRSTFTAITAFNQGYSDGRDVEELVSCLRVGIDMLIDTEARLVGVCKEATELLLVDSLTEAFFSSEVLAKYNERREATKKMILDLADTFCGTKIANNDAIKQSEKFAEPVEAMSMTAQLFQNLRPFAGQLEAGMSSPLTESLYRQARALVDYQKLPAGMRRMLRALGIGPDQLEHIEVNVSEMSPPPAEDKPEEAPEATSEEGS